MRKTKRFVATTLALGMMLACSLSSFAAELPAQDYEASVSVESSAVPYGVYPSMANKTCDVIGEGVALRREPGLQGERIGLFYQSSGAWVVTSGEYQIKDGYHWMRVTDSPLGPGWIALKYIKVRN